MPQNLEADTADTEKQAYEIDNCKQSVKLRDNGLHMSAMTGSTAVLVVAMRHKGRSDPSCRARISSARQATSKVLATPDMSSVHHATNPHCAVPANNMADKGAGKIDSLPPGLAALTTGYLTAHHRGPGLRLTTLTATKW
jgi:hypothetical protein